MASSAMMLTPMFGVALFFCLESCLGRQLKPTDMFSPFLKMNCHSSTDEGLRYFCDPNAAASVTQLRPIELLLMSKGFCSCTPKPRCPGHRRPFVPRVGIAIMSDVFLPDSMYGTTEMENQEIAGQIYAQLILHNWSERSTCSLDVLFLAILWPPSSEDDFQREVVYAAFGPRLKKFEDFYRKSVRRFYPIIHPEEQSIFVQLQHFIHFLPTNIFDNETHWQKSLRTFYPDVTLDLRHMRHEKIAQWPPWSIVTFVGCVVLILISLVVGNVIDKSHHQSYFARTLTGQSNKRWRAGFAGGMMTKQPKKSLGNTMMFRQFNRQKPENTTHYV